MEFLRGKLRSRLSYDRLTIPKLKGGIGFLDIVKYHWAIQLAKVIDYKHPLSSQSMGSA